MEMKSLKKKNKHAGSSFDSWVKEEKLDLAEGTADKLTTSTMVPTFLTETDYIQALDYANVMLVSFTNTMETCAVLKNPKIKEAYEKATEAMATLYQVIGSEAE